MLNRSRRTRGSRGSRASPRSIRLTVRMHVRRPRRRGGCRGSLRRSARSPIPVACSPLDLARSRPAPSTSSSCPSPSRPSGTRGCPRSSRAGSPPGSRRSARRGRAPTRTAGACPRSASAPCSGALPSRIARRRTGSARPSISRKMIPGRVRLVAPPCRAGEPPNDAQRVRVVVVAPEDDLEDDGHRRHQERREQRPPEGVDREALHRVGRELTGRARSGRARAGSERERVGQPKRSEDRRDDRVQRRDDDRDHERAAPVGDVDSRRGSPPSAERRGARIHDEMQLQRSEPEPLGLPLDSGSLSSLPPLQRNRITRLADRQPGEPIRPQRRNRLRSHGARETRSASSCFSRSGRVLIVAAAIGIMVAFMAIGSTFLIVFIGIFLGLVFEFPVRFVMRKTNMSRGLAATITVLGTAIGVVILGLLFLVPMVGSVRDFLHELPQTVDQLRNSDELSWLGNTGIGGNAQEGADKISAVGARRDLGRARDRRRLLHGLPRRLHDPLHLPLLPERRQQPQGRARAACSCRVSASVGSMCGSA